MLSKAEREQENRFLGYEFCGLHGHSRRQTLLSIIKLDFWGSCCSICLVLVGSKELARPEKRKLQHTTTNQKMMGFLFTKWNKLVSLSWFNLSNWEYQTRQKHNKIHEIWSWVKVKAYHLGFTWTVRASKRTVGLGLVGHGQKLGFSPERERETTEQVKQAKDLGRKKNWANERAGITFWPLCVHAFVYNMRNYHFTPSGCDRIFSSYSIMPIWKLRASGTVGISCSFSASHIKCPQLPIYYDLLL